MNCKYCEYDKEAHEECTSRNEKGFSCTREKNHTGDHVACGAHGHDLRDWPNEGKLSMEKLIKIQKQIRDLQYLAENLFDEHVKPLAKSVQDENWLWDFCFNVEPVEDYDQMVRDKVSKIISQ